MNLILSESAQWLHSYGIRKVWTGRTDGRTNGRRAIHKPLFFFLRKGRGTKMITWIRNKHIQLCVVKYNVRGDQICRWIKRHISRYFSSMYYPSMVMWKIHFYYCEYCILIDRIGIHSAPLKHKKESKLCSMSTNLDTVFCTRAPSVTWINFNPSIHR